MICPSCGYETFHPKAMNCDLCAAPLHPEGAAPPGETSGELEAMANLVATGDAETSQPTKKAATAAVAKPKLASAEQSDDAEPLSLLDVLLLLVSFPVTFPAVGWATIGGNVRDAATWAVVTMSVVSISIALGLAVTLGALGPVVFIPAVLAVSTLAGASFLLRQGRPPQGPATIAVLAVLAAPVPFLLSPGKLASDYVTTHASLVQRIATSANAEVIASGDSDGSVVVWDGSSGQPRYTLAAHEKSISALAVEAQTGTLVSAAWDGTLCSWDLPSGAKRSQLSIENPRGISAIALLPGADQVIVASAQGGVFSTPIDRFEPTEFGLYPAPINSFAIGDELVVGGSSQGSLIAWTTDGSPAFEVETAHPESVAGVGFGLQGLLVSGGFDGTLKLWSPEGEPLQTVDAKSPVRGLAVRGGIVLSTHLDGTVVHWALSPSRELTRVGALAVGQGKLAAGALGVADVGAPIAFYATRRQIHALELSAFAP